MKKFLLSLPIISGFLAIALNVHATSSVFAIPSASDLVGYVIDFGQPFLTAFWPVIGLLIGLGIVFFIINRLSGIFHQKQK